LPHRASVVTFDVDEGAAELRVALGDFTGDETALHLPAPPWHPFPQ